jgi:hypothetical protein
MAEPNGFGTEPNGFGTEPNGFVAEPNGFGTEPFGSEAEPYGCGAEPFGFGTEPRGSEAAASVHDGTLSAYVPRYEWFGEVVGSALPHYGLTKSPYICLHSLYRRILDYGSSEKYKKSQA